MDREAQAGGIPRHAAHIGFGLRDLHRLLSGPQYAARYVRLAERAGAIRRLECDTVVFTGDWIPDHELAHRGGLVMDPATRAPRVDFALRTSVRGVFAAGNLLHAAETADIAALSGRHAARAVHAFVESGKWFDRPPVRVVCEASVHWVSPSAISFDGQPPRRHFILRVSEFRSRADLVVSQGTRTLWQHHYRRLVPALPIHVAAGWVRQADPDGEPIRFGLQG